MIPAAAAVLCVPFFFTSVAVEYFTVKRMTVKEKWKKALLWSWLANGTTYALIISGLLVLLAQALAGSFNDICGYIDHSGNFSAQSKRVTKNRSYSEGFAPIRANRSWGFANKAGASVITPRYDDVLEFSEGLAAVTQGHLSGYINKEGRIVIPPRFDQAFSFAESLAAVSVKGKWGYIDKSGNYVIKPQYDEAHTFAEGLADVTLFGKHGYIDKTGKLIIPTKFNIAFDFSEGLACVGDFYIDKTGKTLLELPANCHGRSFSEGMASFFDTNSNKFGFINKTGAVVINAVIDKAEPFSEGLALVKVGERRSLADKNGMYSIDDSDSRYGFIDKTGKYVVPPLYIDAMSFNEGFAAVCDKKRHWGFIDKTGKLVFKCEYTEALSFEDGVAAVKKSAKDNH